MAQEVVNGLPCGTVLHGNTYDYEIIKALGQGSFGITYLAGVKLRGELGTINTAVNVAVKEFFMRDVNGRLGTQVQTGNNSDLYHKYRKDFIREANSLSKLVHPNIVKVLESFEENNTAYFSMEYIEGGNLNDYIQSNDCLSEKETLETIVQVIGALSCMHHSNMLHLDLKPLNLMRRKNGEIVLIDFGLSKQFNSEGEPESSTHIGRGTCGYAPLEQSNYKKGDGFSPTLDIYALGGTLYKMLTGVTPPDAATIFNDGFPENSMRDKGISQEVISLTLWAMEPMKRKRPQTTEEFLEEIKRILPHASEIKKKVSCNSIILHDETSLDVSEECNGFHVRWSSEVSEIRKSKIRELLNAMVKKRTTNQFVNTEYGQEYAYSKTVMWLGEDLWYYLWPIIIGDNTDGYFPRHTIRFVLKAIHQLAYWTGLPFRLSNEDEIEYYRSAAPSHWEELKTLYFSKNKKLQYKTFGADGCRLNDVKSFDEWNIEEYDIQLVCDGVRPLHQSTVFDVPCTQEYVDEIQPIGFNLYKTRKGTLWNIKSPESPMSPLLEMDYDVISYIGVWHVPGGGPTSGFDYFGIETRRSGMTYYYSFEGGKFVFLEMLDDEDIESRAMWT